MSRELEQRRQAVIQRHRAVLEQTRALRAAGIPMGTVDFGNGTGRGGGGRSRAAFGAEERLAKLRPIPLSDLRVDAAPPGDRYVRGALIEEPVTMRNVMSVFECSESGEVVPVAFAGASLEAARSLGGGVDPAAVFSRGKALCIARPFLKTASDGSRALRVDVAQDIVFLSKAAAAAAPAPASNSKPAGPSRGREERRAALSLEEAEAALAKGALGPSPETAEDANARGTAALKAGRFAEAAALYGAAARLAPKEAKYPSNRAAALLQLSLFREALASARQAARLDRGWAKPVIRAAEALAGLDRPDEALAEFERALALEGPRACEDPEAVRERAASMRAAVAAKGRRPGAHEEASLARIAEASPRIDPADPALREAMGRMTEAQKKLMATFERHALSGALQEARLAASGLQGRKASRRRAAELLRAAAEDGLAQAQFELGAMLLEPGPGGPGDLPLAPEEAVAWLKRAAEQPAWIVEGHVPNPGVVDACVALAATYRDGVGVPRADRAKALEWCRRGAEAGTRDGSQARAMNGMGELLRRDDLGQPADFEGARAWLQRAVSEFGLSTAQFNLGLMLERGEGGPVDLARARALYAAAAAQGFATASRALAALSLDADSSFKHLGAAAAADPADAVAASALAMAYMYGKDGAPKDPKKALELLEGLAARGDANASYNCAVLLWGGSEPGLPEERRVERDAGRAFRWAKHAAIREYTPAGVLVAQMYAAGSGTERDEEAARRWARWAARKAEREPALASLREELAQRATLFEAQQGLGGGAGDAAGGLASRLERVVLGIASSSGGAPVGPPPEPPSLPHTLKLDDHFNCGELRRLADAGSAVAARLLVCRRHWDAGFALWHAGRIAEAVRWIGSWIGAAAVQEGLPSLIAIAAAGAGRCRTWRTR